MSGFIFSPCTSSTIFAVREPSNQILSDIINSFSFNVFTRNYAITVLLLVIRRHMSSRILDTYYALFRK